MTENSVSKFGKSMKRDSNSIWYMQKQNLDLINPCFRQFAEIEDLMSELPENICRDKKLPPGKIKKLIIKNGSGKVLPPDAHVYIHYSSYFDGSNKPFDCTLNRSLSPEHYQLGASFLFEGFEYALLSMRENEAAQFLIHPDYAFGKLGHPPRIPGNAKVMVVVNIVKYVDCGLAVLNRREDMAFKTFSERLKYAKSLEALANHHYKNERIKLAFNKFQQAQFTLSERTFTDSDENERCNFLRKVYINELLCLSNTKFLRPKQLIELANSIEDKIVVQLQNDATYHYCLGVAYTHLHEFKSATESLRKAQILSPFLPNLRQAIRHMLEMAGKASEEERTRWRAAFDKLGYTAVTDKAEEPEISEEERLLKLQISVLLKRFLVSEDTDSLNIGYKFSKSQRNIFVEEVKKFDGHLKLLENMLSNGNVEKFVVKKIKNKKNE